MKELDTEISILESLRKLSEKNNRVVVYLKSGAAFEGSVGKVGKAKLVIRELVGRDFSDAIIESSEIVAFEMQVRS